jgi:hypothetical protein
MLFTITVRMEARNSTPSVESDRHISVVLSTTPHIARIESAVAVTMLTIEAVKQILLTRDIQAYPGVLSIEPPQVPANTVTAVLRA